MKAKFLGKFLPKSVRSFVHNILTVDFREPINICDVPNAMTMTYLNLSARVYHWCQRHQRKVYANGVRYPLVGRVGYILYWATFTD